MFKYTTPARDGSDFSFYDALALGQPQEFYSFATATKINRDFWHHAKQPHVNFVNVCEMCEN